MLYARREVRTSKIDNRLNGVTGVKRLLQPTYIQIFKAFIMDIMFHVVNTLIKANIYQGFNMKQTFNYLSYLIFKEFYEVAPSYI